MTQTTQEQQQQLEAPSRLVAAKLQAFLESLTPDEQRALDVALHRTRAMAGETTDDVVGQAAVLVGPLSPLMAALGIVTREWVDQQVHSTRQP